MATVWVQLTHGIPRGGFLVGQAFALNLEKRVCWGGGGGGAPWLVNVQRMSTLMSVHLPEIEKKNHASDSWGNAVFCVVYAKDLAA